MPVYRGEVFLSTVFFSSSLKKRSTIIASGHGCISSKNKSVYPELIGLPYMAAICDMIDF